jgi:ABC-type Zn2+ transport system substrate-binding protein/surface adhesin
VPTVVSAEKQLTMPPQKRSKKNIPTETDQEEHHHDEDNEISLTPKPLRTTDQERRAKLDTVQKARAEKIAHTLEQFTEQDAHEDDDQAVDRKLEIVQQKIQQLQKERKIREPAASKKKSFRKARETKSSKRVN